ncbi:MAG TPA: glycosyltransferase family 1 protein [Actinomycetota bacterium]|nr:glycosyltransferase family 1 protein [Actinomycetota bacterium]
MASVGMHVDQVFYRAPGGIGTYIRELVPAMSAADPTLDLTLFHAAFPYATRPGWLDGYTVVTLPQQIRRLYPMWDALGRPPLPPQLGRLNVIHAPSPATVPPVADGQRLVVTVHDLAFRVYPSLFPAAWRMLFRAGTWRAARKADALITVSENTASDLIRFYGVEPDRVHVIPLAASLPETTGAGTETLERLRVRPPYVLFVGTLEPRKNLVRLVRAYRRAVAEGGFPHQLVLAGPLGWHPQRLLAELKGGGPGEVVLAGRTRTEDLDTLYRSAEIFAYPSLYEGFGLPVLEAMVRGVPVLTSTSSSLPEVAGDAALSVNPRSVTAIAEALAELMSNGPERERLSKAGLARAESSSWTRTANETLKVYKGLT